MNIPNERFAVKSDIVLRDGDGSKPVIVGYAAVFNSLSQDLGGFREIVRQGAFDKALAEKQDVSARIQHQSGLTTIGRTGNNTLRLSVDDHGLRYELTPPNTQAGRDILELVRSGMINKSSFAFTVRENGERWVWESTPPVRELLSVDLYDVAPVDGPAYLDTSVSIRSYEQAKKQRDDEILRQAVAAAWAVTTRKKIRDAAGIKD
jgi:HK97 family phage prohead protease